MPSLPYAKSLVCALRRASMVLLTLAMATLAGLLLEPHVSLSSQAMLYVLAVMLVSYALPWRESIACAMGAVAAFNFFFVPPRWTFEVESKENLIALGTLLLVALTISRLTARLRHKTEIAHRNAVRARQLQDLATDLASATSEAQIAYLGQQCLDAAFAGPCLLAFTRQGRLEPPPDTPASVADGLACCLRELAVLGPGTGRWPGLNAWYVPLGDQQNRHGALCIQPAQADDSAGRQHGQAIAALLAQALWRLQLSTTVLATEVEIQRQQMQSTFLAAISHDLRTPLAAIVGAASALQTQGDKLGPAEQARLLASIVSEATYLSNVTENTLQLMRMVNAAQEIRKDWESVEEIVGSVLARIRRQDPKRRIQSRIAEGLPLIQADPVLLGQLLGNLLDNALKYSTAPIELTARWVDQSLQLSVKDRGPGIPAAERDRIFTPYARSDQTGQRGAGLGLALCRAIAEAHGGILTVRPRPGGGSSFRLTLPGTPQQVAAEAP